MAVYLFDNKIISNNNAYFLKTENDIKKSQVISTLYCENRVIYKRNDNYEKMESSVLRKLVYNAHKSQLQEIKKLIYLSKNYIDLSQEHQFLVSKALFKKGIYNEAQPILDNMLLNKNIKNKRDELFFYLGKINENLGLINEALGNYNGAINLKPYYADYHNCLGEIFLKMENTKDAIQKFHRAIQLNRYYASAHYNLGLTFIQNHINKVDYELSKDFPNSCISEFDTAIEFKPEFNNSKFIAGKKHINNQEWQSAYDCMLNAKYEYENSWNDEFITKFYLRVLDFDELKIGDVLNYIRKLDDAIKIHPDYPELLNELGIANLLFSKILNNSASKKFRRALDLNGNYNNAKKNLKLVENDTVGYDLLLKIILRRILN